MTSIGDDAFYYCTGLTSVTIPNSVTSIGRNAFYNCKSLKSINIPNSVTSIGNSAFSFCSLESIEIPNSVTSIGDGAFDYYDKLSSIVVSEENEYYDSRNNCNAIIETKSNTLIASCLSTVIPNTVTTIGKRAFAGSTLKEIDIPNSVTTIGDYAFASSDFTEINIPNSVVQIGNEAFYWCHSKKIVIPESVESIGDNAFENYYNLDVYFHKNVDLSNLGLGSRTKIHLIINDESNKDLDTSIGNIYTSITYNRNLTPGKYETIILPFAPNAESLENFAFYELTSANSDVLNFSEVAEPQANTPYLYTLRPGKYSTQITGGEATISSEINTPRVAAWKTIGSYASQTVDCSVGDGYYYDINTQNNKLQNNSTNIILKPYRAYFKSAIPSEAILNIYINGKDINEKYTITYILDGDVYYVESLEPNNQIPAIDSPQKEGYTFDGWETLPSSMPSENIIVYAKFIPNNYTVSFKANGEIVYSELLAYGTTIVAPDAPEIEDYAFVEWLDLLETVPAHDVEFVAAYKQVGVRIADGVNSFTQEENKVYDKITYTRTLPNLQWNALFVPFEIPVSDLADDYDVAYINDIHSYDKDLDGEIDQMEMEVIYIKEETLHANHPYLIRAKSNEAKSMNIVVTDATLYSSAKADRTSITCSSAYNDFEVIGTYEKMTAQELDGCYAINTSGAWSPIASGASLNPFRLYMTITSRNGSPVKVSQSAMSRINIRVQGEDTETGIDEIVNEDAKAEIYDMAGRRLQNAQKGIYIINGKKVIK